MLDAVHPAAGDRLLDVGTGTGVVARAALGRVGQQGAVIAVDPNDGMLAVARRLAPGGDIRRGSAAHLTITDSDIDCITCQFALMFVTDRARAIGEMARVLRPGGRLAVATWAAIEQSPGYAAMVDLLGEEIGDWAAAALRAPFCIGTADELGDVMRTAFPGALVEHRMGYACFASLDDWLHTEIRGWTLAERIDDDQFARLRPGADIRLRQFVGGGGRVRFPAPALIATATAA